MSFREKPVGQSTPASYLQGAVPISVPRNPSLPPAPRTPSAPYWQLFAGLPVDPVLETEVNPPTSGMYLTLTGEVVAEICLVPPSAVTASLQRPLFCPSPARQIYQFHHSMPTSPQNLAES
jgi:hypothetical protein